MSKELDIHRDIKRIIEILKTENPELASDINEGIEKAYWVGSFRVFLIMANSELKKITQNSLAYPIAKIHLEELERMKL